MINKISRKYQNAVSAAQNVQKFYLLCRDKKKGTLEYEAIATGTVKEFELAYETFWKYLKFYLENQGLADTPASPRAVFLFAL